MTGRVGDVVVRKSLIVEASPERAFEVFTNRLGSWWPLAGYHIGEAPAVTAVMEPVAGGRWFERAADGSECDWGRVLVWEPPTRVVLTWEIGADWRPDPGVCSEIEVIFVPDGAATTRVELEHRGLEAYGSDAPAMQALFDSEGGWTKVLALFAERAGR